MTKWQSRFGLPGARRVSYFVDELLGVVLEAGNCLGDVIAWLFGSLNLPLRLI